MDKKERASNNRTLTLNSEEIDFLKANKYSTVSVLEHSKVGG